MGSVAPILTTRIVNLYGPDQFRIDRSTVPEPAADEVLVKVMVCGICGSDLGYVASGGLMGPADQPMPLGHELSAVVVRVGEKVSGLSPGMRVVVNPMAADNNIGNGGPEGGFADYLLVRGANRDNCILPLPENVDFHRGALVEPLAVALHAVNQAQIAPAERAVLFGAGPIGLGIVAAFKRRGGGDIVIVEPSAKRRELALETGADCALEPTPSLWEILRERHGESQLYGFPVAATEVFFEASGVAAVLTDIVAGAGPGARMIVVALHKQPVAVDFTTVLMKELTLRGAMGYPQAEFSEVIELLASGELEVAPLISQRFELDDFEQAFKCAGDTEHGGKVLVEIGVGAD